MFWTGSTGKRLRENPDAQRAAMYLMTGPHAHQTGVYYLPKMYLAHEVGLTIEGASEALSTLQKEGFCIYDETAEWVWVCEMAAWQIGTSLPENDKRCKGVQQYVGTLPSLSFLDRFSDRYATDFHLSPMEAPSMGHPPCGKPHEGGIPLTGSGSGSGSGTDQEQGKRAAPAASPPSKRSRAKKPQTALPADFTLDDELREYAESRLPEVDPPALFEGYCGKARAKGWVYADWRQAFMEFCRNAAPDSGHWSSGQYPRRKAASAEPLFAGRPIEWQ